MASTHIEVVSTASRLGSDVRALIDSARRLYADADKCKNIADEVAASSDWAALAGKLGCTDVQAQLVYNLLVGFNQAVKVADFKAFINRLG